MQSPADSAPQSAEQPAAPPSTPAPPPPSPPAPPLDDAPSPSLPSPRSAFRKALPGLIVCVLALAACVLADLLKRNWGLDAQFTAVRQQLGQDEKLDLQPTKSPLLIAFLAFQILVAGCGLLVPPFLLLMALLHRPLRFWLEQLLAHMARRPLPAVGLFDAFAAFGVTAAAQSFLMLAAFAALRGTQTSALIVAMLALNDVAMSCALLVVLLLAYWRASGWHGTQGFFPPWSRRFVWPKRGFWADVGLGLAAYPFAMGAILLSVPFNRLFAPDDKNQFIVSMLKNNSSPVELAVIMLSATLGAAFFEETLFRGVLYNALRRHLGGPTGAILAAFIFAQMHGSPSHLFALFVLGLVLTWLYDKTGRLIAGMTLHFTWNLVTTLYLLAILADQKK